MNRYLDFEKDIENIEKLITELDINKNSFKSENAKLLDKKNNLFQKIYSNLSAWDKVQVARHPNRPHTKDYINLIFKNVIYLHGDKKYADDSAILGGIYRDCSDSKHPEHDTSGQETNCPTQRPGAVFPQGGTGSGANHGVQAVRASDQPEEDAQVAQRAIHHFKDLRCVRRFELVWVEPNEQ